MSKTLVRQQKTFAKHDYLITPHSLIQFQHDSYEKFIKQGIKEVFKDIFPVNDYSNEELSLDVTDYYLEEPKVDCETAKEKDINYESALHVNFKLTNKKTGEIKEQEIYFGDIPTLTSTGTFIINGNERVVISQLTKSPGAYFAVTLHQTKNNLVKGSIIPKRGAWLEFITENDGTINAKIDRRKKVPATTILKAFGVENNEEIKNIFSDIDTGDIQYIEKTLSKDNTSNSNEALLDIYKKMRPKEPLALDNATSFFNNLFKRFDRYSFDKIGRYKFNKRLNLPLNQVENKEFRVLHKEDIIAVLRELISMNNNPEATSDIIDHLGNRRVRSTGESLQDRFFIAVFRMKRLIQDRMTMLDPTTLTPAQLISPRILTNAMRDFFNMSPLSQFMDQVNALSELEHKRRLTGSGPGGIKQKTKGGVEIRDIQPSHYGRICPINSPEGPNVGLVLNLATFSRLNELGFLETPYFKVNHGKITKEIVWFDANEEENHIIARGDVPYDNNGNILEQEVECRFKGDPQIFKLSEIEYIDVSPYQLLSPTSALIPFVERNEARRALMGSVMQKQAVPGIIKDKPLVATGMEKQVARDSGQMILAKNSGIVKEVDANHILIETKDHKKDNYPLKVFVRTNQNTCFHQTPIVHKNDEIKQGQVIADSSSTQDGQLSLGHNLLVAFMPWYGYTFEDAIVISENLLKQDVFTSVYTEEFICDQQETQLGPEIITRDIPNISEKALRDLDEDGIIRLGAEVEGNDILVGKISPKGEVELTPEERLMRAIFGSESKEVRNTSLFLKHGRHGRVIKTKILSRKKGDKLEVGIIKRIFIEIAELRKVKVGDKLAGRHGNKGIISIVAPAEDMPFLEDGTPVDIVINALSIPNRMNLGQIFESQLGLAADRLHYQAICPPFDGATEEEIKEEMNKANIDTKNGGKVALFDGRTGQKFEQLVTIGKIYMMKLNHMVADKMHARSVGPYALITQQPLKGRSQMGGQRFGEMEVWALEAYGAAKTLQEMLTIKSDDIISRREAYAAIIKNDKIKSPTIPAAFNVILSELKALCLNIEIKNISPDQNTKSQ